MKKQILFLALFVIALFSGTSTAFGQALGASTNPITPLLCVTGADQPLHPFAGVPYIYSLTNPAGGESVENYTWWATKDPAFITAAGTTNLASALASPQVLNVGPTYGVTTLATVAGANQVSITWSADILAGTDYQGIPGPGTPTFVVGYAEGVNCADNIQVYEINPMPNFTVDIAPIDPDDDATLAWDATTADLCVDDVQTATYNNTSKEIDMNYGINTIYFEVAAANFVLDWTPTFRIISGLRTSQTAVISMYGTKADALGTTATALWTSGTLAVGDIGTDIATDTELTAATATDAFTGVSVFVKVIITNDTEESLTSNPFELAVDAQDNSAGPATARMWDMEDADCTLLADAADQIDRATITVTPRPRLDHATVDTNVLAPNERVVKTNP